MRRRATPSGCRCYRLMVKGRSGRRFPHQEPGRRCGRRLVRHNESLGTPLHRPLAQVLSKWSLDAQDQLGRERPDPGALNPAPVAHEIPESA